MESYTINNRSLIGSRSAYANNINQGKETDFRSYLRSASKASSGSLPMTGSESKLAPQGTLLRTARQIPPKRHVISAYQKQVHQNSKISDWQKYKDDQLLSNPGGDRYCLEQKKIVSDPKAQKSFWGRLKKDLSDSFGNIKNFFKDFLFGAKKCYRNKNNEIQETGKRGFIGSVCDFFKNIGSALSFGKWGTHDKAEPRGIVNRIGFFCSKMKKAFFGDLLQGVPKGALDMGEDLALAAWNLAEVVPDATIGNVKAGREMTSALFDNGQVGINYLADILPTGEAWQRVHAAKLNGLKNIKAPVLYNIKMPERNDEDARWKHVRNTPLRKTMETIGSLVSDVLTFKIFGQSKYFSEKSHERRWR